MVWFSLINPAPPPPPPAHCDDEFPAAPPPPPPITKKKQSMVVKKSYITSCTNGRVSIFKNQSCITIVLNSCYLQIG